MTLAELVPAARQLPAADKLRLIRILAEELDAGQAISPFVPHKVYDMPTPYSMYGVALVLQGVAESGGATHG